MLVGSCHSDSERLFRELTDSGLAVMVDYVRLVFIPEIAERAVDGIWTGISKPAQAGLLHHQTEFLELCQVFHCRTAVGNLGEHAVHLHRSAPARTALAAALIHAEFHEELGHVRHAALVVHYDQTTRTHNGTELLKGFIVYWNIEIFSRDAAARRPPGLGRLERAPARNATAYVIDDFAQGNPDRDFNEAGVSDFTGESKNLGTLGLFGTKRGVVIGAL